MIFRLVHDSKQKFVFFAACMHVHVNSLRNKVRHTYIQLKLLLKAMPRTQSTE